MGLKLLLIVCFALIVPGCVGLDLAEFDDDELARLLGESPSTALDDSPADSSEKLESTAESRTAATADRSSEPTEEQPVSPPATGDQTTGGDDGSRDLGQIGEVSIEKLEELGQGEPDRNSDVIIATIGEEVIRLPELTRSLRRRIEQLPEGRNPSRRSIITMVRAEMEVRVLASLVEQQARQTIPDQAEREAILAEMADRWSATELPAILQREGLDEISTLAESLSQKGRSLEDLQSAYQSRALARELIRREGLEDETVDAYLARLRDRFPITSDFLPADLSTNE